MGKMGIWEGMGKEEEEKSGGKEKIFWEKKFFIPPRSVHYGCDRVLLLTTLYGELVGGL